MCKNIKFNSRQELLDYYHNIKGILDVRNSCGEQDKYHIAVCSGTGCQSLDSSQIVENLRHFVTEYGVQDKIEVSSTGCFGFCAKGPIVIIFPDNTFYVHVKPSDAERIIKEHFIEHHVVEDLLYKSPSGEKIAKQSDIPFYKKQHRIALAKAGVINPEVLAESIATRGYQALAKAIFEMSQDEVIEEISASGLRGRGGAGFPTGTKWKFAKASVSEKKYIICNADEGDPGAFMDRSIMEGDPHTILEAMAIAGYAVGANEGEIYIRAEYPLAVNRLRIAIKQATDAGLLGDNILGSNFSFHINIKYVAGAFVCGEETA